MRRRIASTCSSWVIWFGSGRLVAGVGGAFCATAGFGCTGGRIEKEDYGYGIDDVKCKDGQEYEFKLGPNFKVIVMTRD